MTSYESAVVPRSVVPNSVQTEAAVSQYGSESRGDFRGFDSNIGSVNLANPAYDVMTNLVEYQDGKKKKKPP